MDFQPSISVLDTRRRVERLGKFPMKVPVPKPPLPPHMVQKPLIIPKLCFVLVVPSTSEAGGFAQRVREVEKMPKVISTLFSAFKPSSFLPSGLAIEVILLIC